MTPPPPFDVTQVLPSLSDRSKQTIRLHPRRSDNLPLSASKLGGEFLWPEGEVWPICTEPEETLGEDYDWANPLAVNIVDSNHPRHNDVYTGILQLRASEFRGLEFPQEADLFQLLWCPRYHENPFSFDCKIFWRKESLIERAISNPSPKHPEQYLVPYPCRLFPEQVIEYPHCVELNDEEKAMLDEWKLPEAEKKELKARYRRSTYDIETNGSFLYQFMLSTCPGVKVGGYVDWIHNAETPYCECSQEMEHLLTVSSGEFDRGSALRWCPIEDQKAWESHGNDAVIAQVSPFLTIGDCGSVYVFICRHCDGWPIKTVFQCS